MSAFAFGLGVLLGVAITLGIGRWFLQTHFGSPLVSLFQRYFQIAAGAADQRARYRICAAQPGSDFLLLPFIFADSPYRVGEIPWRDWRIPILYVLLPLAVILRLVLRPQPRAARCRRRAVCRALSAGGRRDFLFRVADDVRDLSLCRAAGNANAAADRVCRWDCCRSSCRRAGCLRFYSCRSFPPRCSPATGAAAQVAGSFCRSQDPADLGDTSNLMILMAGFEPYSHLVPEFPPQIPFVRIQSNFSSPEQDKGINRLLHERVDAHRASGAAL